MNYNLYLVLFLYIIAIITFIGHAYGQFTDNQIVTDTQYIVAWQMIIVALLVTVVDRQKL